MGVKIGLSGKGVVKSGGGTQDRDLYLTGFVWAFIEDGSDPGYIPQNCLGCA